MGKYLPFLLVYVFGGLTFLPLLLGLILLHAYLTLPQSSFAPSTLSRQIDHIQGVNDDTDEILKSGDAALAERFQRGHEPDVAAGYFAVCREYVPGGVHGKPPERTTPAGAVIAAESPSVYQSMYRSIFDRKQGSGLDPGKGSQGKSTKRARNVFYVVLRHRHLMLYDDSEQLEVRHVISLAHHDVSIYGGGDEIPDGELWIKRNAICLKRKPSTGSISLESLPFYLFSESCSDKEDFYFALLQNQEREPDAPNNPPRTQHFEVKHIISLVQRLHSSEEQLQTRWINGLIGRLFLAMYKTQDIEEFIRRKISKKIARVKKPAFLSKIVLQKIDMGERAPYITSPRLKDLTVDGDCCAEADFKYDGNFRLEIAATARIDLGSRFKVREVNLVLAVVLKRLEGHAMVRFKPPPSNRVWITFATMPQLELAIEPIVSSRQITYTFIIRAIESRIREVFAETLVFPHWDDSPFTDTSHQQFRGGIWERENAETAPATTVPDEEAEDELEGSLDSSTGSSVAPITKDERVTSLPSLLDASQLTGASTTRKSVRSNKSLANATNAIDIASSSSVQKRPEPPRMMRSHSFASAAGPIVSIDNVNVDASKQDTKSKQQQDATSAMRTISNRSRPTSPTDTPGGSLPKSFALPEVSKRGSFSSSSSKADSAVEPSATQSNLEISSQTSLPETASTDSASGSIKSAFGNDAKYQTAFQSVARSLTSTERKQSMQTIGAATAAAKKWGWGVISRNEQKGTIDAFKREGTPEHPIGRGRPLPPPGTPLPPPERPSSKVSHIEVTKRKPLPPPLLPQRRQEESTVRSIPAPPLPARKEPTLFSVSNNGDDGVLVVEAPPDSAPPSPGTENGEKRGDSFGDVQNQKDILQPDVKEHGLLTSPTMNESIQSPKRQTAGFSSSYEDDDSVLSSWKTAQEEEARSKSIWIDDNEERG